MLFAISFRVSAEARMKQQDGNKRNLILFLSLFLWTENILHLPPSPRQQLSQLENIFEFYEFTASIRERGAAAAFIDFLHSTEDERRRRQSEMRRNFRYVIGISAVELCSLLWRELYTTLLRRGEETFSCVHVPPSTARTSSATLRRHKNSLYTLKQQLSSHLR